MHYQVSFDTSLAWQVMADWQMPDTPFMQFAFWQALFDSRAIGEGTDWLTMFALVKDSNDNLIASMPVFVKDHHQGEYVFDYAWAEAYSRYGQDYYPRLVDQCAIHARDWRASVAGTGTDAYGWTLQALNQAVDHLAKQVNASTWHGLFLPDTLVTLDKASKYGAFTVSWAVSLCGLTKTYRAKGLAIFDEFLSILTAKKT